MAGHTSQLCATVQVAAPVMVVFVVWDLFLALRFDVTQLNSG